MDERGQALVEFALIALVMFALTVGLIGSGQAFYQYNAVSELARYGARWAGVVGGTCAIPAVTGGSKTDFCSQLGNPTVAGQPFWSQDGNRPLQGPGVACPSFESTPADYYTVSDFTGPKATTIVASVADHFDTTQTSVGFLSAVLTAGFNSRLLKVCIATTSTTTNPAEGSSVSVTLHYSFTPVSGLLLSHQFAFSATSQYSVE